MVAATCVVKVSDGDARQTTLLITWPAETKNRLRESLTPIYVDKIFKVLTLNWLCQLSWQYIPSVASKCVHVKKKHVLIGCKYDMFCHQTLEVQRMRMLSTWFVFAQQNILCKNFWTLRIISSGKCAVPEREIFLKVEKNEIWAERADQKHINNLPLAQQFALTAVKLQMFGGKTHHVCHPIRTCFLYRVHA